jgi:ATP-dependent helicase/nuclease subunit B
MSRQRWARTIAFTSVLSIRGGVGRRDQLIAAGWQADGAWSGKRLVDLAAAEHAARELPDGLADRIARLNDKIDGNISRTVRRIRLIDARAHHPIGWRRLFDALDARGVMIEEIGASPSAPADTALGRVQRWIAAGGELDGSPDGSVTLATSTSSALAGELLGQWFSIATPKASTVLVAQDADTQLLDHGLLGAGQPRAGRSRRSPHRGSLQPLLLAFKIAWLPFDAHALMELLLFAR